VPAPSSGQTWPRLVAPIPREPRFSLALSTARCHPAPEPDHPAGPGRLVAGDGQSLPVPVSSARIAATVAGVRMCFMSRILVSLLPVGVVGTAAWLARSTDEPARSGTASARLRAFGPVQPRLSPAGDHVVFSYQGALWVMPVSGGTMTR